MDGDRSLHSIRRSHEAQGPPFFLNRNGLLLIARCDAFDVRNDPYLQKMRSLALRVIELAMNHTGACAHALHISRRNGLHITHAVFVRQFTREYITDDLHVLMTMIPE